MEELTNGSRTFFLLLSKARTSKSYTLTNDTAVILSMDGTIHSVRRKSGTVVSSYSTGPPICSIYHAASVDHGEKNGTKSYNNGYFIKCGDDVRLSEQRMHFDSRISLQKLQNTIPKYVNSPPHVSDGTLTFGYKDSNIFLLDVRNGSTIDVQHDKQSLVSKQRMQDLLASGSSDQREFLVIKRTDFHMRSVDFILNKTLWNMTFAQINATHFLQGVGNVMPLPLDYYLLPYDNLLESPRKDEVLMLPDQLKNSCEVKKTCLMEIEPVLTTLPSDNLSKFRHKDEVLSPSAPSPHCRNLDILAENETLPYQLKNLCEVKKTCLTEIDVDSKQIVADMFLKGIVLLLIIIVGFVLYCRRQIIQVIKSDKQTSYLDGKRTVSMKKRKARQKGKWKSVGNVSRQDNHMTSENEDPETAALTNVKRNGKGSLCNEDGGRRVGKLFVSNKEIAKGCNGTIVFEGIAYDDEHSEGAVYDLQHPVAVKRLVRAHNDVAFKEIKILRESKHSNIVHLYGVERDSDFVYIALERCTCSLNDLIQQYSDTSFNLLPTESPILNSRREYKVSLESSMGIDMNVNLWEANGYPSPQLLKLMRDVIFGLAHLHKLGIIHRDLKPHNVLISSGKPLCAKLADMGISKCLHSGMSSLGHLVTGYGSSGWQAPEQLIHGRQTRAVDLFSLGCLLFFCITKGQHPFGEYLERDSNIARNQFDLFLVEHIPEAVDLFSHLLDHNPDKRPKAEEVLHHPLFWSSADRLRFLQDASGRVEKADREGDSDILNALENVAPVALNGNWDEKLEDKFIKNIGNYRRYKHDNVRDLLRLIRNKSIHYIDLPEEVQELVGPYPDGCYDYFARPFPKLLIEVYKVIYRYCREETLFRDYFKPDHIIQ